MLRGPIVLVLMFAAQSQGPANTERARHQGIWAVTSSIRDGEPASAEVVASIRRVVEGDHVVWKRDGKNFAGTRFEIDPTKTPRTIDLLPDGGPNRDKRVLGIYKLDGEDLTICIADVGQPRPSGFEAKPGSKQTLQTFKRVKP
jgi:uncharacterized protein (TIGR03067 family)